MTTLSVRKGECVCVCRHVCVYFYTRVHACVGVGVGVCVKYCTDVLILL